MRPQPYLRGILSAVLLAPIVFAASACHSYHIDATIENRTGAPNHLLEVDYPSASFGVGRLENGAAFHYQFQVRGSGPLKIEYTMSNGRPIQISGPTLTERQQGQLQIVLQPGGKAEYHPQLAPPA